MAWSTDAARPLAAALDGALAAPGTVIAVACIDDAETVIQVNPDDTPADGRFEVGSVTKTMTATLLAPLAADGSRGLMTRPTGGCRPAPTPASPCGSLPRTPPGCLGWRRT